MATSLQATNATNAFVNGSGVWASTNDGSTGTGGGSGPNVGSIWNYGIDYFDIRTRVTTLDVTSGNRTTFYPMNFAGSTWGTGIAELYIRKSFVHQGGGGAGAVYGRLRYRSTAWGHHGTFWEMEDNWGGGFNNPYIANADDASTRVTMTIWLRGETTYFYNFNSPDSFTDTDVLDVKPRPESNNSSATVSSTTSVSIPSNARYYQKHICGKSGYNLGDPSFRWATVFASAENASSDARFKEDISDSYGLDFLMKLKPRTYIRKASYVLEDPTEWDEDKEYPDGDRRTVGFIAQEVEDVLDEMGISVNDFAGFDNDTPEHLSLMYAQFVPILVKSLQEKKAKRLALEKRVKKLEGLDG